MRIVQINAVYGIGSTGRIVQDISRALTSRGHEAYVFWAIRCKEDDNASFVRIGNTLDHKAHALLRRLDGKQGWHSKAATRKACKQILKIAPDVVHLHNLHSNYIHLPTLLRFLGEHNIPTLITLHDCWMFTAGHCVYYHYYRCNAWIDGCAICPARSAKRRDDAKTMYETKRNLYQTIVPLFINGVSKWTAEAAKQSMLGSARDIRHIYNWVDTDVFKPQGNAAQIREKYAVPAHHKLILGVAQGWNEEKGLKEFLQIAREMEDTATVLLVGQDLGVPRMPNLRCIGFTNDRQELVDLYSAADLLLNPSKAETFGLVTVEAMACGTPVVAYNNTGTSELITDRCGYLAPDGDATELIKCAQKVLAAGKTQFSHVCRQSVCENFEKEKQIQKYMDYYGEIISDCSP